MLGPAFESLMLSVGGMQISTTETEIIFIYIYILSDPEVDRIWNVQRYS